MQQFLGIIGYGLVATGFVGLILLALTVKKGSFEKRVFILSSFLSAVWAASLAYQFYLGQFYVALLATETLCNLGWIALILCAIRPVTSFRQLFFQTRLGTASVIVCLLSVISELMSLFDVLLVPQAIFGLHLMQSILGLLLLEHLFRQVHPSADMPSNRCVWGLGSCLGMALFSMQTVC